MNRKNVTSLAMAIMMVASVSCTQCALPEMPSAKQATIIAGSIILGAGVYRLFLKNPVRTPGENFDKEALSKAIKERNYKEIKKQLWYFFDERYVGQRYKSRTIKCSPDGKNLEVYPGCRPTGLLGIAHAHLYPIGKVISFAIALDKLLKNKDKALDLWSYYTGYDDVDFDD